jgi:benzoyl-CoA reductase/2-hydroxyglutaryl-CoA dehydratase subunit BcrC/BadD/HgdB
MTLELSDEEIARAVQVVVSVHRKHREIWIRKMPFDSIEQVADLLEEFEKEIAQRMMESVDCLVRVDGTPILEGHPPIVEWLGKIEGTSLAKYGQDHERKTWEVQKAQERNEDYLGQTGKPSKND